MAFKLAVTVSSVNLTISEKDGRLRDPWKLLRISYKVYSPNRVKSLIRIEDNSKFGLIFKDQEQSPLPADGYLDKLPFKRAFASDAGEKGGDPVAALDRIERRTYDASAVTEQHRIFGKQLDESL